MTNQFERLVKGFWWGLVTVIFMPFALLIMYLGIAFEWMGGWLGDLFMLMCKVKHFVAPELPPTPDRQAEIEAAADADL